MLRGLRFLGLLLLNLLVALSGTAIIESGIWRIVAAHSIPAVVWKEATLSTVVAGLIGFFTWRTWHSTAAKWTWVFPAVWFTVGAIAVTGHGIWGHISEWGALDAPGARSYFAFTVPLIRGVSYSLGAYFASCVLRPKNVPEHTA